MTCPKCGGKLLVVDTRHDTKENETYRQKECASCHTYIYSVEYEVFAKDVQQIWNSLDRRHLARQAKKDSPYSCFGRYCAMYPVCAECKWKEQCSDKANKN